MGFQAIVHASLVCALFVASFVVVATQAYPTYDSVVVHAFASGSPGNDTAAGISLLSEMPGVVWVCGSNNGDFMGEPLKAGDYDIFLERVDFSTQPPFLRSKTLNMLGDDMIRDCGVESSQRLFLAINNPGYGNRQCSIGYYTSGETAAWGGGPYYYFYEVTDTLKSTRVHVPKQPNLKDQYWVASYWSGNNGFDDAIGGADLFITHYTRPEQIPDGVVYVASNGYDSIADLTARDDGKLLFTGQTDGTESYGGAFKFPHYGNKDIWIGLITAWADEWGYAMNWATSLGGTGEDAGVACSSDSAMNMYVVGNTKSPQVPAVGPLYTNQGGWDIVLAKYASNGARLNVSGWGTSANEEARAMFGDGQYLWVIGDTDARSVDGWTNHGPEGTRDIFVAKFHASNLTFVWARLLGDSGNEFVTRAELNPTDGLIYITGNNDKPMYDLNYFGGQDVFIVATPAEQITACKDTQCMENDGSCTTIPDKKYLPTLGGSRMCSALQDCPAGRFCKGSLANKCPMGTWSAAAQSSCEICMPGTWNNEGSPIGPVCELDCGEGFYCFNGVRTACPEGTFGVSPTAVDARNCKFCPDGKWSQPGAMECSACGAGNWCKAGVRTKCPAGTSSSALFAADASACAVCRAGVWTLEGQATCPAPGCQRQQADSEGATFSLSCSTGIHIVDANYGTPDWGSSTCEINRGWCDASNSLSIVRSACEGKTSCSFLAGNAFFGDPCSGYLKRFELVYTCGECGMNYYCANGTRTECSENKVTTTGTATSVDQCVSCSAGSQFVESDGRRSCELCTYETYGTDGVTCELCPGGFYSYDLGSTSCVDDCGAGYYCANGTWGECSSGSYSTDPRASDPSTCVPCAPGKWSGSAQGTECTSNCLAGFTCKEGVRTPCPAGSFSVAGSTNCSMCPEGTYSTLGSSACSACSPGSWSETNNTVGPACPLVCGENFYCENKQRVACPQFTLTHGIDNAASLAGCTVCPEGTYYVSATNTCDKCASGKWSTANRTEGACADPCPVGFYCDGTSKVPCPEGTYSVATGLTVVDQCTYCAAGKWSAPASQDCTLSCGAGNYCIDGQKQTCSAGRYGTMAEASSDAECPQCQAGSYQSEAGMTTCATCGENTFAIAGQTTCNQCAAGLTSAAASSVCSDPCPAGFSCANGVKTVCAFGFYSGVGASVCTKCDDGKYDPQDNRTSCSAVCPAGSFCINGLMTSCAVGSHSAAGAPICTTCEDGKWDAAGTHLACADACPAGYFCVGGIKSACAAGTYSATGASVCTVCDDGKYNADGTRATCSDACPAGSFCVGGINATCGIDKFSAEGASSCTACADGKWDAAGTHLSCSDACTPGYACASGMRTQCPEGTFTTLEGGAVACTNCAAGNWSTAGRVGACEDACPRGYFCKDGVKTACAAGFFNPDFYASSVASCLQCPAGQISTGTGAFSCTPCEDGWWTPDTTGGRTECTQPCGAGYSCTGGVRAQCGLGQSTFRRTTASSCIDCIAGTYADHVGMEMCVPCDAGTWNSTVATQEKCTMPCEKGFYCSDGKRQNCPGGSYNDHVGAKSIEECHVCPAGTYTPFWNTGTNSLYPSSECLFCPDGWWSPAGSRACTVECPEGYICSHGVKTACPVGTFGASRKATSCTACAAGTFSSEAGSTVCRTCDLGTWSEPSSFVGPQCPIKCPAGFWCSGATKYPCPIGTASSTLAASSADTCVVCPLGTWSAEGAATCSACGAGLFCDGTGKQQCAIGTFTTSTTLRAQSECTLCPAGTRGIIAGAGTLAAGCTACVAGKWSTAGFTGSECTDDCPIGSYCVNGVKYVCPIGTYNDVVGASSQDGCKKCPAGTYSDVTGATALSACKPCAVGRWGPEGLGHACTAECSSTGGYWCANGVKTPCPAGRYTASRVADSATMCNLCSQGTWSVEGFGGTACLPGSCGAGYYCRDGVRNACPAGSYGTNPGAYLASACIKCRAGTHSTLDGRGSESACEPCAAGTYTPTSDVTSVEVCPDCGSGYFCTGGIKTQCPAGTYQPSPNGASPAACLVCPAGTYSAAGSSVCTPCEAGKWSNPNSASCELSCEIGYWCALGVKSACPSGTKGMSAGAANSKTCEQCAAGTYQPDEGRTVCFNCADGKWSNVGSSAVCTMDCGFGHYCKAGEKHACANNYETTTKTAFDVSECVACLYGNYTRPTWGYGTCQGGCFLSPCRNGGTCIDTTPDYTCACAANFVGVNCEQIGSIAPPPPPATESVRRTMQLRTSVERIGDVVAFSEQFVASLVGLTAEVHSTKDNFKVISVLDMTGSVAVIVTFDIVSTTSVSYATVDAKLMEILKSTTKAPETIANEPVEPQNTLVVQCADGKYRAQCDTPDEKEETLNAGAQAGIVVGVVGVVTAVVVYLLARRGYFYHAPPLMVKPPEQAKVVSRTESVTDMAHAIEMIQPSVAKPKDVYSEPDRGSESTPMCTRSSGIQPTMAVLMSPRTASHEGIRSPTHQQPPLPPLRDEDDIEDEADHTEEKKNISAEHEPQNTNNEPEAVVEEKEEKQEKDEDEAAEEEQPAEGQDEEAAQDEAEAVDEQGGEEQPADEDPEQAQDVEDQPADDANTTEVNAPEAEAEAGVDAQQGELEPEAENSDVKVDVDIDISAEEEAKA